MLDSPRYVTTVARCFRNEDQYNGLQRLWAFTMREIVCIGPRDGAESHLTRFRRLISEFGTEIGLQLQVERATDPFFDANSPGRLAQIHFPSKEEFIYDGACAVASSNYHRQFFGRRYNIHTGDAEFAFSSCVAFGLERWLHALIDR